MPTLQRTPSKRVTLISIGNYAALVAELPDLTTSLPPSPTQTQANQG